MKKPPLLVFVMLVALSAARNTFSQQPPPYELKATPSLLSPGETAQFQLQGTPTVATFTKLTAEPPEGLDCDVSKKACTAKNAPGKGLAITGVEKVTATFSDGQTASTTVTLTGEFNPETRGPWEGRVIIGYHQAGAASADFTQNVIIDTYIVRPIGKDSRVWESRWNSWGNVRIASIPRQLNTPFVDLLQGLATGGPNSPLNTNVNELAQSAEFQTGLELNLTPEWDGKMLGLIGFFGATGTFEAPDKSVRIFAVPSSQSAQFALFKQEFPAAVGRTYIGFANPDRDRFYRQYGFGFRYSKFNTSATYESPLTYSFTIGQDEAITGGRLHYLVGRVDAFYPLPFGKSGGKWRFFYLFGTATLRLSRGRNITPLILEPAPSTVNAYDPEVVIVTTPSNRDTYRIGIGVDLVGLIRAHGI
jgi:hypothetical protein